MKLAVIKKKEWCQVAFLGYRPFEKLAKKFKHYVEHLSKTEA